MLIIGTRFFAWGSDKEDGQHHCSRCGFQGAFIKKSGMRFLTVFFVIPVCPLSGVRHMIECPGCKTRYEG